MERKINAGVVVKHDFSGGTYYQIREIVTDQGEYIEWPGIYSTSEAAYAEIRRVQRAEQPAEPS